MMLYLGHFYFDGEDSSGEESCGHFTCLAEAVDIDAAVKKFKDQIYEMKENEGLFDGYVSIYVDDIIEIEKVPEEAIAVDFISSSGDPPKSVGCSLPSEHCEGCTVYDWIPEGAEDDEDFEAEPFVQFEDEPAVHQSLKGKKKAERHLRLVK
jgi:hypothetical protein